MDQLEAYHPVVELISAWRTDTKLQSAYSEKIPASVETNGKIYPAKNELIR